MFRPLKVATPLTAFTVRLAGGANIAPAVPDPALITSVTAPLKPVAVLPKLSRASTTGWVGKAVLARALLGEVVKTSWVAVPPVMLKGALFWFAPGSVVALSAGTSR